MAIVKNEILKLYKALLREGSKFSSYNFRTYALRRIRSKFREMQQISDQEQIENYYIDGLKNLGMIRRQVIIDNLYKAEKLVIENIAKK